jgi:hypothetical protein
VAAISKRLRYEVMRRDGHACYYCGAKPPEVKLVVDAVVPEALGGSHKDPANLVTACDPCNSGKSSASPDAPLVAAVADDAAKWAEAKAAAAGMQQEDVARREAAYAEFDSAWDSWAYGSQKTPVPRPDNWRNSVDAFLDAGLPFEVLLWCINRAMGSRAKADGAFRYMCGIAWRRIAELREAAGATTHPGGGNAPAEAALNIHTWADGILCELDQEDVKRGYRYAKDVRGDDIGSADVLEFLIKELLMDRYGLRSSLEDLMNALPNGMGNRHWRTVETARREQFGDRYEPYGALGLAACYATEDIARADARAYMAHMDRGECQAWKDMARELCEFAEHVGDAYFLIEGARLAREHYETPAGVDA